MAGVSLWMCLLVFLRLCTGVAGKEHTHYIAVEEIDWDYAPGGDLTGYGPRRLRTTYRKAVYREYTDASFTVRKSHPPEMGLLGPTMAGTLGDEIHVYFKNMASRPFSLHVSSAIYRDESNTNYTSKANEGAKYGSLFTSLDLPTDADMDADDEVPPGGTHLYKWAFQVDDQPGIEDDLCVSSVYYSHSQELTGEVNSGPVGVLLSCHNDGDLIRDYTGDRKEDIKKSYILLVQTIDETKSRYAKDNGLTSQDSGKHTFHAINGYVDGNLPGLDICSGEAVLWYVVSMGTSVDVHSLMFHGHAISSLVRRTTALPLMAGSQVTGRMVGQEPGRWLIRDAFDEHFLGGATAFFNVLTCENKTLNIKRDKVQDDAPVRKYYIAAEEVDWDYAPSGEDKVGTGGSQWSTYATRNEKHIGTTYKKARFIEYTDERFTDPKPRDPAEEHLGILGPLIKAAVGDRITIVFRNKASRPYSMFAQAVKYDKDNEGFKYNDGTSGQGAHVQPDTDFTYEWSVPKRWSPLDDNEECVVSMYHSATDPVKDVHTGLVGPLMICNPTGYNRPLSDYYPDKSNSTDYWVSADFFLYMSVIDENKSWYLRYNVKKYAPQADTKSKSFRESNRKHSINGYIYGNMPILDACYKHRYQINVITLGDLESIPSAYVNSHVMQTDNSHPMSLHAQPGVSKTGMLDATSLGTWLIESLALGETSKGMAGYMKVEECIEPGQYIDRSRPPSVTRQYYIAAVEMDWDYAPFNYDFIREMPLWKNLSGNPGYKYVGQDGALIGSRYRKVLFREYMDANFTQPKPQARADLHFGLMGPVIRAENGDVIKVVFKNLASRPYSIRALGLQVNKTYEGYKYTQGGSDGSEVRPMETFEYTWSIPYSHSVSFGDGWCELRVYHSAVDAVRDVNSGLIGPITICSKGRLKRIDELLNGKFPRAEFFFLFHTFDENLSWYFKENLQKYADKPNLIDTEDEDFKESNRMHSINGRIYGNLEGVVSKRLSSADVYLMSMDTPTRPHSINFHVRLSEGKQNGARMRRRTIPMYPGTTTWDEKHNAFKPGAWLVKSVMADQYEAGMALIWDIDDNFHDMVSTLHRRPGSLSFWHRLSKTERIWFIIGVVGAVLVLFLVCYCMCMKARKRSGHQMITDPTPRPV